MKQISLLGCGWLGFPLAKSLLKKGFSVNGSTTSADKISVLKNAGIQPFLINVGENKIEGEINSFLENSEVLIVDIPPKLRGNYNETFVKKIQTLIPFIEKSSVKKVLFVSSTSVYANDNSTITEDSKLQPDTENGKQYVATEQLLQSNRNFQTTIIRFGGLIGEDRHPITFLAGRKNLENPKGLINLIHQDDCIGILEAVIHKGCWNETFNAVTPFHPTRKEYYTQKAAELGLSLPEFNENQTSNGKLISSKKAENFLNYNFKNNLL